MEVVLLMGVHAAVGLPSKFGGTYGQTQSFARSLRVLFGRSPFLPAVCGAVSPHPTRHHHRQKACK